MTTVATNETSNFTSTITNTLHKCFHKINKIIKKIIKNKQQNEVKQQPIHYYKDEKKTKTKQVCLTKVCLFFSLRQLKINKIQNFKKKRLELTSEKASLSQPQLKVS